MRLIHVETILAIVLSIGCSNSPTPARPDTGAPDATGDTPANGYPAGPYGTDVGAVVEDHTFPDARKPGSTQSAPVSLKSYHDLAKSGTRYLVLNVAAFWCSPCKEEAKSLQKEVVPRYKSKGVEFLSIVLQRADKTPAAASDIDTWAAGFGIDQFTVADDPEGFVTKFFDPSLMPLNMIIDTSTMKIVHKTIGANLPDLTSQLDRLLGGV